MHEALGEKPPEAAGVAPKLTVPTGFDLVPESVSETIAVQLDTWLSATGLSHVTVEVHRCESG